jgi:hypothetical protein
MTKKWTGMTMLKVIQHLVVIAMENDDETAIDELIDMRKNKIIPKSAVNYVIHKFAKVLTIAKHEVKQAA